MGWDGMGWSEDVRFDSHCQGSSRIGSINQSSKQYMNEVGDLQKKHQV